MPEESSNLNNLKTLVVSISKSNCSYKTDVNQNTNINQVLISTPSLRQITLQTDGVTPKNNEVPLTNKRCWYTLFSLS